MDIVFNFILEFKEYFIYGLLTFISLIQLLVLLFKKKIIVCNSIQEFILNRLPVLIIKAESVLGSSSGLEKKKLVFNEIIKLVSEEYKLSSDSVIKNFNKFINYHLEEILCTPQSKGGNING